MQSSKDDREESNTNDSIANTDDEAQGQALGR